MQPDEIKKLHAEATRYARSKTPRPRGWDAEQEASTATCKAALTIDDTTGRALDYRSARALTFRILDNRYVDACRHAATVDKHESSGGGCTPRSTPSPDEIAARAEDAAKVYKRLKEVETELRSEGEPLKAELVAEFLRRWEDNAALDELTPAALGKAVRRAEIEAGTLKESSAASWGCRTWKDDVLPRL